MTNLIQNDFIEFDISDSEDEINSNDIIELYTEEITPEMSISQVAKNYYPLGWEKLFKDSEVIDNIANAENMIHEQAQELGIPYSIVPLNKDIFNAFHWCPLNRVKVIIVGQDPYLAINSDGLPQAWGASFATRPDTKLQPSLKNIYIELANSVPGFQAPQHGDLRTWARQGVLLLNTALTANTTLGQQKKYKHYYLWSYFVQKVLQIINISRPNTVVMLWGREAQHQLETNCGKLKVLTAAHPSPFSAKKFWGCNHFNLANEYLIERDETPIDWRLPLYTS